MEEKKKKTMSLVNFALLSSGSFCCCRQAAAKKVNLSTVGLWSESFVYWIVLLVSNPPHSRDPFALE
jgi:hypothetical protein